MKDSALLIPVLSKAWFASPWYRQEFTTFTEYYPDWSERLFPVWMGPMERNELDEEDGGKIWDQIRDLLGYPFWYKQASRVRIRWFPDIDSADRDYGYIQQDMARDMAERLKQVGQFAEGIPSPAPAQDESSPASDQSQPPTPCNPPVPPIKGDHFVVLNGGSGDLSLVQEISRVLDTCEGLGYVVPLMVQDQRAEYKPSELRRDLSENFKLATAVLMVVHKGPRNQINEQVREYRQATAKRRGRALRLEVCQLSDQPLGFNVPGMRVHKVGDDDIIDCACDFARGLQV